MSKKNKFIGICCFLLGAGIIVTVIGFSLGGIVLGIGFTSQGLQVNSPALRDGAKYESADISLNSFESIDLSAADADIEIVESDHYGISYQVMTENNFSYEVKNNTLKITQAYKSSGSNFNFMFFGFNTDMRDFKKVYITVYVPANTSLDIVSVFNSYGAVKLSNISSNSISLDADSGNIVLSDITTNSIEIYDGYGDIDLLGVTSPSISLNASSGDIKLENIETEQLGIKSGYGDLDMQQVLTNSADITMSSGAVNMKDVTASMTQIDSGYGDVNGNNISIGDAVMKLDSGKLKLDMLTMNCITVQSGYGDVLMNIDSPISDYYCDLYSGYGTVEIDKTDMSSRYQSLNQPSPSDPFINVGCDSGNIKINGQ